MKYDMEEKISNGFSFDTTKFVLGEVKKEALKTAMEERGITDYVMLEDGETFVNM